MEIKVGEYVRTVDGKIGIFDRYSSRKEDSSYKSTFNCFIKLKNRKTPLQCHRSYIKTHSEEPIDILEVGDIIKLIGAEELKYEILKISWSKSKGKHIHIINPFITEGGKDIFIEDIAEILTHEQYEQNTYRLEEK